MQTILLNVLMWLLKTLSSIFITPILALIETFIPDVSTYIIQAQNFFTTYIFDTMRFCIRLFLNVTRLPQSVLLFGFTYLTLKITLHISMQAIKLIMKIWGLIKP